MNQNYSNFTGQVLVNEFFAETDIPVLKDMPFVQGLDINAAVRNTDYSSSGNVTTWKAGVTWDIDENVRLRATRSHDIRAPNLNELYNPGSEGNPNVQNKVLGTSGFIKSNTVGNTALRPESGRDLDRRRRLPAGLGVPPRPERFGRLLQDQDEGCDFHIGDPDHP